MDIPSDLRAYFHDSTLTLHSYDPNQELCVRIEKEIGPEVGIITFREVSFISIHQCFPGDAIKATPVPDLPDDFWFGYPVCKDVFEPDDIAFQIDNQEGPVHLVVAKSISYEMTESSQISN